MPKILNVANRLPVTIADDRIVPSSGGLVAALEGVSGSDYDLLWIGWPGAEVSDPGRQKRITDQLRRDYHSIPVFLTNDEQHGFYEGLSNSSLWPLLHYMPSYFRYDPIWWEQYVRVNATFAQQVLSVAEEGDLVWIHDYQLMMLPEMLRQMKRGIRIGFFLHTPFPSYELFRCHPHRNELLHGMLGAHQIGFHTFGYMRHFRSCVARLLGIDSDLTRIRHDNHITHMGIYPIGINARRFDTELDGPAFDAELATLRQTHQNKTVILSVERLDYTKGILRRLDAIDHFLKDTTPEQRDRLKFIFIAVPSREGVEEYQDLRNEVEHRVGKLNGSYATIHDSPIHFVHSSVSFTQLCALYSLADVAIVTPLIDGMNLVAKEYVACQREEDRLTPGVLVLSEFAGAAEELYNALVVNPYDHAAVAGAIAQALAMGDDEKRWRMRGMRQRVMNYHADWWARSFLRDLASRDSALTRATRIDEAARALRKALDAGRRVALFLDYDGTLREIERDPMAAGPSASVRQVLEHLAAAHNVDLTLISGRTAENLQAWLGEFAIGLIAEHGAALRRPGHAQWEQLDRNISYGWKEEIGRVLRNYEASTPRSFVEDKRTGLVWHYRKSDPEFGEWKAKQLADELAAMTANLPLVVRHGKKIVEVTATQINKGAAIMRILEEKPYDLVVVAGDDETDESMFKLDLPALISVKIGEGRTQAKYQVPSPSMFRRFLTETFAAEKIAD